MVMDNIKKHPGYLFLLVLGVSVAVGFQSWRTMLNNYAVNDLHFTGLQMGMLQSVREIPGFLAFSAVFALLLMRPSHLAVTSVFAMGVGILGSGWCETPQQLILATFLMSTGFHCFETMNQSLSLLYFDIDSAPHAIARLKKFSAFANIMTGVVLFGLTRILPYSILYTIAGGLACCGAVYGWTHRPAPVSEEGMGNGFKLKKKYSLYYILTFLSGARRQIFVVFAVFLMVQKFDYSVQTVALLFVLNNLINVLWLPQVGKMIAKMGEKKVLHIEYTGLIFVFVGYALCESALLAGFLYVMDNLLYSFAIAIRTYFQKIAPREDISSNVAVAFTINHIAAVVIPVSGGLIWEIDYRITFLAAAVMSVVSLVLSFKVNSSLKN
jgi:hypothetical protein